MKAVLGARYRYAIESVDQLSECRTFFVTSPPEYSFSPRENDTINKLLVVM